MKDFNIQLELDLVKESVTWIKKIKSERDSYLIKLIDQELKKKANELNIGVDVLVLSCFIKGNDNPHLTDITLNLVKEIPIGTISMREQIDTYCKFKALEFFAKEKLAYFDSRVDQCN